jgi:hypothetical protein
VTVLVPEDSAESLRQFANELLARHRNGPADVTPEWRKLSPSAELLVHPGYGGRCAIRDTGAPGADRYYWTVMVLEDTDPVAAGRTRELTEARSLAELALGAYAADRRDLSATEYTGHG